MEEYHAAKLIKALFQEADIDIGKDVEHYKGMEDYDEDEIAYEDYERDMQEALSDALLRFFSSLSEATQEEIKEKILAFAKNPDWIQLQKWQLGIS